MKILTKISLATVSLFVFSALTYEVSAQPQSAPLSAEEQELNNARRANEEAQAEYYREQTKKLHEPSPTPTPTPVKSFRQSLNENPASVGTFVAALLVAIVGLVTLFVNQRSAIQNQRDTQFYEALKRFGDKDSPTVRCSAAGILAQMAALKVRDFNLLHPIANLKKSREPYFQTALSQLITGSILEDNMVSLRFIANSLKQIIKVDDDFSRAMLSNANRSIQDDIVIALAEFFATRNVERLEDINEDLWAVASSMTWYKSYELKHLIRIKSTAFSGLLKSKSILFKIMSPDKAPEHVLSIEQSLRSAATRLVLNIAVYNFAFVSDIFKPSDVFKENPTAITPLFLSTVDLSFKDLSFLKLNKTLLSKANMRGVNLNKSTLHGAWLLDADLSDAKLAGVKIDDTTDLKGVNWWMANFFIDNNENLDVNLLEYLYNRYKNDVPENTTGFHPSVLKFLSAKKVSEKLTPAF